MTCPLPISVVPRRRHLVAPNAIGAARWPSECDAAVYTGDAADFRRGSPTPYAPRGAYTLLSTDDPGGQRASSLIENYWFPSGAQGADSRVAAAQPTVLPGAHGRYASSRPREDPYRIVRALQCARWSHAL